MRLDVRVAAILAVALFWMPASRAVGADDGWEAVNVPAPSFEVKGLTGGSLRSAELTGKIVVVDFWASWCKPCVQELPSLARYHKRLARRSDVAFLSLNVGEDREIVERFLKASPVGFPVYCGDPLVEPYELAAFPTKMVIDMRKAGPDGTGAIRFRREGLTTVKSIEERVAALLAERP